MSRRNQEEQKLKERRYATIYALRSARRDLRNPLRNPGAGLRSRGAGGAAAGALLGEHCDAPGEAGWDTVGITVVELRMDGVGSAARGLYAGTEGSSGRR